MGYGGNEQTWEEQEYEKQRRKLKLKERMNKKNNKKNKEESIVTGKQIGRAHV